MRRQVTISQVGKQQQDDILDRLILNTRKSANGCIEWTKCVNKGGYGRIQAAGKARNTHRTCYELIIGPIPKGMVVCHRCDNPLCVSPSHLSLGTHQDNEDDKTSKGRRPCGDNHFSRTTPSKLARGEQSGSAKMTAEDVIVMRCLYHDFSMKQRDIAKLFGISQSQAAKIVTRASWTHVA